MAMYESHRPAPLSTSGVVSVILARLIAWNDRRVTLKALKSLTPWQLSDVGLTRADLMRLRNR